MRERQNADLGLNHMYVVSVLAHAEFALNPRRQERRRYGQLPVLRGAKRRHVDQELWPLSRAGSISVVPPDDLWPGNRVGAVWDDRRADHTKRRRRTVAPTRTRAGGAGAGLGRVSTGSPSPCEEEQPVDNDGCGILEMGAGFGV